MTSSHFLNFMYFLLKQDVGEDMLMGRAEFFEENGFIGSVHPLLRSLSLFTPLLVWEEY